MEKTNNSVDDFFEKLPAEDKEEANIFDEIPKDGQPQNVAQPKVDDTDPEQVPESIKDRRHRRLEQRLQAERESNIALTTRLQTLSEMDKFAKENDGVVDPDIAKMFDSSETGKQNALRLSQILKSNKEAARQEAITEIEQRQEALEKQEKQYEATIDNELEALEDEYGIDLTSNAPKARKARTEFLTLIQEVSPKDENGDITGYADFESTFKLYQKNVTEAKPDNSRQKEIAARSMQRSGSAPAEKPQRSRGFDGWKTDLERGNLQ